MNNARSGSGAAYLAALLFASIIGFSFLFVKLTVSRVDPLDVLAHRFALTFIVLTIPALAGWMRVKVSRKDIWRLLPLGLFSPVLFFTFQTFGLLSTSSSEAGIIQAMTPVFTLLLASILLKEKTTVLQKLSLLLSVAGVVFIFAMKGGTQLSTANLGGIALIMLSALCFSAYSVLARPLSQKYAPLEITYVTVTMGFVVFNILSLGKHLAAGTIAAYTEPLASPVYLGAIAYLGIASTLVSTLLSSFALSRIQASKMSVFSNFSTLVSIIAGALLLKEELYYYHIAGAAAIIIGVLGTSLGGARKPSGKEEGQSSASVTAD
ncbi:DMT family transporter [Paenibacillus jiagnxiensis]|uniref:DMT family transporter n=1 Tax=Paenibacillus jiagnxiensis TaxID=3228926 RepID=UPI0033BD2A02